MIERNFENFRNKVAQICSSWSARTLTKIGKILVVNTLITSQFVYKFLHNYNPSRKFLEHIKQLIRHFIWDGKPSRVAYNKLIRDYPDGGLKLVDLSLKVTSLEAAWVPKIALGSLNHWVNCFLPLEHPIIWECNVSYQDVVKISPYDGIWSQIWGAWSRYNYQENVESSMITNQFIWFNSHIRKNDSPFKVTNMYNARIWYMHDILSQTGFLTYDELQQRLPGDYNFLEYYSLLKCIPDYWKHEKSQAVQIRSRSVCMAWSF